MNTEEALDLMLLCLPHIEAISKDEEVGRQLDEKKNPDLLWLLIGKNRVHTYSLLSLVLKKSIDDIKNQDIKQTYNDINEVMGGEFMLFFTLLSRMAHTL